MINPKALQIIEEALQPIIQANRQIQRIKLVVCPTSKIAELNSIQTAYGNLLISKDSHVPKGISYLIEDPGHPGRGFAWVTK